MESAVSDDLGVWFGFGFLFVCLFFSKRRMVVFVLGMITVNCLSVSHSWQRNAVN